MTIIAINVVADKQINNCYITVGHYNPVRADYNNSMKVLFAAQRMHSNIDTTHYNLKPDKR